MKSQFPEIGYRGNPQRAWAIGSGLDVWEIVGLLSAYRGNTRKLRDRHPLVTERHLEVARVYAERFPEEIEARLEANRRPLGELLTLYPFLEVAD